MSLWKWRKEMSRYSATMCKESTGQSRQESVEMEYQSNVSRPMELTGSVEILSLRIIFNLMLNKYITVSNTDL